MTSQRDLIRDTLRELTSTTSERIDIIAALLDLAIDGLAVRQQSPTVEVPARPPVEDADGVLGTPHVEAPSAPSCPPPAEVFLPPVSPPPAPTVEPAAGAPGASTSARFGEGAVVAGEHVCPECGRTFDKAHGLTVHLGRAHGVKAGPAPSSLPAKCPYCDAYVPQRKDLASHIRRRHPTEKPTAPVVPIRTPEGAPVELPAAASEAYVCEHCGRRFDDLTACSVHEATHQRPRHHTEPLPSDGLVLVCQDCGHQAKSEAAMAKHVHAAHHRLADRGDLTKRRAS